MTYDLWFRGKTLAEVLGYSNPLKAIRMHIDSEDKEEMLELVDRGGAPLEMYSEGLSMLTNQDSIP